MDCVSPIFDVLSTRLRDAFSALFGHVISLESNVHSLKREMRELECLRDDVMREVDAAERQGLTRTSQVKWWLESVQNLGGEAAAIEVEFERLMRCFGSDCPVNLGSRYRLGRRAAERLTEVRDLNLKSRQVQGKVADGLILGKIEEVPTASSSVGMDLLLERLGSYVAGDHETNIIGLHGMGGVGKTTLLKVFNNQLLGMQHGFDLVVFLEVTRDPGVDRIHRALGSRLGLQWRGDETQEERAAHILRVLSKLNFVMLLDDVWEPLDLASLGIPILRYPTGQHLRKVVVATRIADVCINMDSDMTLEVECLPMEEAWDLFVQKVGIESIISHPRTLLYAQEVVKICGGLPVALATVGRAMATKRTHREWLDALGTLALSPWDLPGVAENVFDRLRPSYDHLPTDELKACFLFCSLFPEGLPIKKILLLYYWLCEGILHLPDARSLCDEIIGMLIRASCLLEHEHREWVNMHSMMRSLALWIASERGQRKNKWLVQGSVVLNEPPSVQRWNEAERISLIHNGTRRLLPAAPSCPNLLSLMLQHNDELHSLPSGFFHFMPALTTLDLSYTSIERLPPEIGMLPEIRYLSLFNTRLVALPEELGRLAKLMCLEVGRTPTLRFIPRGVIARLSPTLVLLGMFKTRVAWQLGGASDEGDGVCFEELEDLHQMRALDISIDDVSALQRLSNVDHLASHTGKLQVFGCEGMTSITLPSALGEGLAGIKMLTISDSSDLEEVVVDPDHAEFSLTFLAGLEFCNLAKARIIWRSRSPDQQTFACLHTLIITNCPAIEELVEGSTFAIRGLQELHLTNMLQLMSICCDVAMIFPTLQYLKVDRCPKLKRLPIESTSDNYMLTVITGQREWWDGLEWKDSSTEASFQPFFKQLIRS